MFILNPDTFVPAIRGRSMTKSRCYASVSPAGRFTAANIEKLDESTKPWARPWLDHVVSRMLVASLACKGDRSAPLHEILGSLLEIETAHWWRPTAANYFDRVAKARTLEALDAAGGPELVSRYAGSKKAELASAAERIFSGNFIGEADVKTRAGAWVPEMMRFGSSDEPLENEAADPAEDETANEIAEQAA